MSHNPITGIAEDLGQNPHHSGVHNKDFHLIAVEKFTI